MMKTLLGKWFRLRENHTNIRTEIFAGVTIFLSMAYIMAVNPAVLAGCGMPKGGVLIATAGAAAAGTLLMAFFSNYPFVLAPGMGMNAYFAYTVVIGMGYSWHSALMAIFIGGIIFLLLTLTSIREAIFNIIPLPLKMAISVGIGLFITLVALNSAGIIVNNPATPIGFPAFTKENFNTTGICAILTIFGVLLTSVLLCRKAAGAIFFGILATWVLGMIAQATALYVPDEAAGFASLYPHFSPAAISRNFQEAGELFGALFRSGEWSRHLPGGGSVDGWKLLLTAHFGVIVFSFLFVDLFDTLGSVIGIASQGNLLDRRGQLKHIRGILAADSLSISFGAVLGTSTTTIYVESTAGIACGGRTGLTACTAALLFLVSLIFAPLFLALPPFATAPALIIVGFYMISNIAKLDFSDLSDAIPACITIFMIPFSYSIADGIAAGIISWTLINSFCGQRKRVGFFMYLLTLLFIAKYILL